MRCLLVLLAALVGLGTAAAQEAKTIVLITGRPSHGYGAHEHNAGCTLLAKELMAALPRLSIICCFGSGN